MKDLRHVFFGLNIPLFFAVVAVSTDQLINQLINEPTGRRLLADADYRRQRDYLVSAGGHARTAQHTYPPIPGISRGE